MAEHTHTLGAATPWRPAKEGRAPPGHRRQGARGCRWSQVAASGCRQRALELGQAPRRRKPGRALSRRPGLEPGRRPHLETRRVPAPAARRLASAPAPTHSQGGLRLPPARHLRRCPGQPRATGPAQVPAVPAPGHGNKAPGRPARPRHEYPPRARRSEARGVPRGPRPPLRSPGPTRRQPGPGASCGAAFWRGRRRPPGPEARPRWRAAVTDGGCSRARRAPRLPPPPPGLPASQVNRAAERSPPTCRPAPRRLPPGPPRGRPGHPEGRERVGTRAQSRRRRGEAGFGRRGTPAL